MGETRREKNPVTRSCYLEGLALRADRSFVTAVRQARAAGASLPRLRRSLGRWMIGETAAACLAVAWEAMRLGDLEEGLSFLLVTLAWAGFLWWIFDIHLPLVRKETGAPQSSFGLPNGLTTLRMIFLPAMVFFLAQPQAFGSAAIPLLIGPWALGLTDMLDGQIARRFHWTTVFGRDIDPAADILVTTSTTWSLAWAGLFPWWLAGLVAFRYLGAFLGFFFLLLTARTVRVRGTIAGKMTTPSVQILSFILAYDRLAHPLLSGRVECILSAAVGLLIGFNVAYLVWYAFFSAGGEQTGIKT